MEQQQSFRDGYFVIFSETTQGNNQRYKQEPSANLHLKIKPCVKFNVQEENLTDLEKLAFFLLDIPSSEVLMYIDTIDLAQKLVEIKNRYVRLGLCLLTILNKSPDYPDFLEEEVKQKRIARWEKRYIEITVQRYLLLWNLLEKRWEIFQPCFKKTYPSYSSCFDSPLGFFREYFQRELTETFLECTQSIYYDIPKDWFYLSGLLQKKGMEKTLSEEDEQKLKKLAKQNLNNFLTVQWEKDIDTLSSYFSDQDPEMREYFTESGKLMEESMKLYKNRMLGQAKPCTWIGGVQRSGTWYRTAKGEIYRARRNKSD